MTKTRRKRRPAVSLSVQLLLISFHHSSAVSSRHAHTPKLCQSNYKLFQCSDCNCRRLAHRARQDSLLRYMSKVCCALPCPAFQLITPFRLYRPSPSQGFNPFSTPPSSRSRDTYSLIFTFRLAPPQPTQATSWLEHALISFSAT